MRSESVFSVGFLGLWPLAPLAPEAPLQTLLLWPILQAQRTQDTEIYPALVAEVWSSPQCLSIYNLSFITCSETSTGKETLHSARPNSSQDGLWRALPCFFQPP